MTDAELAQLGRAIATAASRGEDVATARKRWFDARAAKPRAPDAETRSAARTALEADRARLKSVNAPKRVAPGELDRLQARSAAAQRRLTQLRSRAPQSPSPSPERIAPPPAALNAMAKVDSYWEEPVAKPRRRRREPKAPKRSPRREPAVREEPARRTSPHEEPAYRPRTDDLPVERASHVRMSEQERLQSVDRAEDAREKKARARRKGSAINLFRRSSAKTPAAEKTSSDDDYEDDSDATPPPLPAKKGGLFGRRSKPPAPRPEPTYHPRDDAPAERASRIPPLARPAPAWGSDSDDEPVGRVAPARQSAPLGRQTDDDRARRYVQRDYSQVTIGSAAPKAAPTLEADSDGEYDMNPDRARRGSGGDAPKKQRWPWQSRPVPRASEQTRSHERPRSSNRITAPASDSDDVERLGTNAQHFRNVDAAAETEYRRRKARSGGATRMLHFLRPWGNKGNDGASRTPPRPCQSPRAAQGFRQSPAARDDDDY